MKQNFISMSMGKSVILILGHAICEGYKMG